MPQSDLLAKQRTELKKRLDELRPLHDEYLTLLEVEEALKTLNGVPPAQRGPGRPATKRGPGRPASRRRGRPAAKRGPNVSAVKRAPGRPAKRKPGRPATKRGPGRPAAKSKPGQLARKGAGGTAAKRGPGRPRAADRGVTRADEALKLVSQNPGITVPEIARELKVRQNYLYRVMDSLQKKRAVKRRKRGYHPA